MLTKVEEESFEKYPNSDDVKWNTGYIDIIHDSIDFSILKKERIVTDFAYLSFNLNCFDFEIKEFSSILTLHSVELNPETEECFVRYLTDAELDKAKNNLLQCTLAVYKDMDLRRKNRRPKRT